MFAKIFSYGLSQTIAVIVSSFLLVVACSAPTPSVDVKNTGKNNEKKVVTPGNTLMGNYLAGLHAQSDGDTAAAGLYFSAALEMDPDNFDLTWRTFLAHLSEGNMDEAISLAHRIIETSPEEQFANLTLIADDFTKGHFEQARERINGLKKGGLNTYLQPLLLGWSFMDGGSDDNDGQSALSALSPLKETAGLSQLYTAHAALMNATLGNNDQAETLFITMIEQQGSMSLRKTRLFGAFYEGIGNFDKAGALYNGYVAENGAAQYLAAALDRVANRTASSQAIMTASQGAAEALFDLSGSLRQQNALETALLLSNIGLHLRPDFSTLKLITGGILESMGRVDSARTIYAKIDPSSEYSWDARLRMATILDDQGRSEQAIKTLRQMADERPEVTSPLIDIGDILRRQERFKEAIVVYNEAFTKIQDITKNHWSLYYSRGIALERVKNWPLAEQDFKKALELHPDQPYVLNYLAYSWVEKGINLDEAQEMLRNARTQRPNDAYIIDSAGWVHYQLGAYAEAVNDLEEAVELLPQDPVVNDHLGDAYWQVGRRREARFQWRRSLSMNPEPDLIPLIKKKIEFGMEAHQTKTENQDGNG